MSACSVGRVRRPHLLPRPRQRRLRRPLPLRLGRRRPPPPDPLASDWDRERLRGQLRAAQARLDELEGVAVSHRRLLDLLEANAEVLVAGDTGGLPARVLAIGLDLVGAERAAFFRIGKDGAMRPVLTQPEGAEFGAISKSVVRDALLEKRSVVHQGRVAREGLERQSILDLDLETVVATPLLVRERLLGVLYLDGSRAGRFTREDLPVLEIFSKLAAAAMLRLEELEQARAASAQLADENRELRSALGERTCIGGIVAASPAMLRVLEQVRRFSRIRSTVRITGETGTGKELVARALHSEEPLGRRVPSCPSTAASIPETLLEAELFGHEKGAFTGADSDRAGPLRAGGGRHALPRRDRRHAPGAAGQAAARARHAASCAGWAAATSSRWTCASSPPRMPTSTSSWPPAASARTSSIASTC